MGGFIHRDTTLRDILPVSEEELGPLGLALEATGENLKAPTNADLERKMINNYAASGVEIPDVNRLRELDSDDRRKVESFPSNKVIIEEMGKRTRHQADIDQTWAKFTTEKDDLSGDRIKEQIALDDKWINRAKDEVWEPTAIKKELSRINLNYRAKIDYVNQQHGLKPEIYKYQVSLADMSQDKIDEMKLNQPLKYAEQQYYELLDKHSEKAKAANKIDIDWKDFESELSILQNDWGEELLDRFEVERAASKLENHAPGVAQDYITAMQTLSDIGWWGDQDSQLHQQVMALDKAMPKRKDGRGLLSDWLKWLEGGTEQKQYLEKNSPYAPKIKQLKARRSSIRHELKLKNPEIDKIAIKWFGTNPVHMNHLPYFMELYIDKPSRFSTPTGVGYPKATIIRPR
jgi:arsenate reductase-like glutaredoxin family protein